MDFSIKQKFDLLGLDFQKSQNFNYSKDQLKPEQILSKNGFIQSSRFGSELKAMFCLEDTNLVFTFSQSDTGEVIPFLYRHSLGKLDRNGKVVIVAKGYEIPVRTIDEAQKALLEKNQKLDSKILGKFRKSVSPC